MGFYTIFKYLCKTHMVIDKYFQKREHEFLYVLAPQRSEIKTGGQNLKMIFNGKSPSASFSYNHPKFRAHLSTVCAQWKYVHKPYVSSTVAGSGSLSQLCFPYISTPLAPKL